VSEGAAAEEGGGRYRVASGWHVDVTVTASSAAWANRCAHTQAAGSIDPVAAVCASRVMTFAVTSSLAPFASRRRAFRYSAPLLSAPSYATTAAVAATHGTVLI